MTYKIYRHLSPDCSSPVGFTTRTMNTICTAITAVVRRPVSRVNLKIFERVCRVFLKMASLSALNILTHRWVSRVNNGERTILARMTMDRVMDRSQETLNPIHNYLRTG